MIADGLPNPLYLANMCSLYGCVDFLNGFLLFTFDFFSNIYGSYRRDTHLEVHWGVYMGMYMCSTDRGSVEFSRVRATTLPEFWRVHLGVESKPLVVHKCLLVLFS